MIPLKDNIPTDGRAVVTIALIMVNVIVYLLSLRHGGSLVGGPTDAVSVEYGAIPFEFSHPGRHCGLAANPMGAAQIACEGQLGVFGRAGPQPPTWETAVTGMFLHGGLLHIAGNMLFLWIFGNNVEDAMGRGRFLAFYLLGGLVALAGQILVDAGSTAPTIGASGAVAAVLGGYILLYPRARVLTLVFIIFFVTLIELPALVMLGLWFAQQIVFGYTGLTRPVGGGGGGVAYFAHVGGFAFGLLLIRAFVRRRSGSPPLVAS